MKEYYVYILASKKNGTISIGVTNNLIRRVEEHKNGLVSGFTKDHGVHLLVYFEMYNDVNEALLREKRLKKWKREWKLTIIEKENPNWNDLYNQLL